MASTHMIEIVVARLDEPAQTVRALSAWLCEAEQRRAARLVFERDRRRFVVARGRLRELLGARLGLHPAAVELECASHGKPRLAARGARAGWRFNLSRCGEIAVYAFSRAREVGVDVEAVREIPEADALAASILAPGELRLYRALEAAERPLAFLRGWTRREALVKALGTGLGAAPESLEPPAEGDWRLHSFSPRPGFIAAIAHRPA